MSQRTIYASAARTATPTAVTISAGRARALRLVIDATAVTATPSVVCTIDAIDSLSGKAVNLLTSAAIATVSTVTLQVGPGLTAAANLVANSFLADQIRITMTHGDADSITYSVSAHLIR
jgi:hypothetical protein